MSGHVIYEMAAGKELTRLIPSEVDYQCVEDEDCKEILQYIFTRKDNGRFERGIIKVGCPSPATPTHIEAYLLQIQNHWFFGGSGPDKGDIKVSDTQ